MKAQKIVRTIVQVIAALLALPALVGLYLGMNLLFQARKAPDLTGACVWAVLALTSIALSGFVFYVSWQTLRRFSATAIRQVSGILVFLAFLVLDVQVHLFRASFYLDSAPASLCVVWLLIAFAAGAALYRLLSWALLKLCLQNTPESDLTAARKRRRRDRIVVALVMLSACLMNSLVATNGGTCRICGSTSLGWGWPITYRQLTYKGPGFDPCEHEWVLGRGQAMERRVHDGEVVLKARKRIWRHRLA